MKFQYKSLLILILLLSSIIAEKNNINRQKTQQTFQNLKNSSLGKDIYSSIELELSTGNSEHIVDTILGMLYELRDQFTQNIEQNESEQSDKDRACNQKLTSLQEQITDLENKITIANDKLPTFGQQVSLKEQTLSEQQAQIDTANAAIARVHEKNNAAVAAFEAIVQEHDDMVAALERAKELISSLLTTGFLQKTAGNQNPILAQLSQHKQLIAKTLPNHKHKGIFTLLISMAEDIGTQADQDQVANIIAIIDELIKSERDTQDVEQQAENKRLEKFQFDLTRASGSLEILQSLIADSEADIKTLQLKENELTQDLAQWNESLASKQEQFNLQGQTCQNSLTILETTITNNNEILVIIEQVIEIFESQEIQDIRDAVQNVF